MISSLSLPLSRISCSLREHLKQKALRCQQYGPGLTEEDMPPFHGIPHPMPDPGGGIRPGNLTTQDNYERSSLFQWGQYGVGLEANLSLGLHLSSISPSTQSCFLLPIHRCCSQEHSLINILTRYHHLKICFLRNLTCNNYVRSGPEKQTIGWGRGAGWLLPG